MCINDYYFLLDVDMGSEVFGRTERSFGGGSLVEPPARPNAYWDDPHFRPYFDNTTDRNVTYQLSKTGYLHCRIRQLGDRVVSAFYNCINLYIF